MIYFFDNELNIVKVTTSKNVISAVHEHELNGLILGTVETDLSYTEAFIDDVDYFGYYYKDNYYLHKIKRVEHEHDNELIRITGRHIFFEDMLYGDYIRDVRPENRDALYILNQTISANTRWQTVMTDTSKVHTTNYYWVPPMEVINDLTENVGIEYEPRILFDGQKINGFQLHVANRIGEDTPIRVPFGSRVVSLKYEVDYSEIVTALYGHGKGEEVGDGYGRRINFRDVNFSRNGVVSPAGLLYMENPSITARYGKDDGSPKFGRIVFEDIEDEAELAEATYTAYLEQSRPKMLFEASVVDLGDVDMGDGVVIIRREHEVYFTARIHKLMVDLLDAENADVELGDYEHFKESKVARKTRQNNNQFRRVTSNRIQQLKEQFNERFDGEVAQMWAEYEQALIDAHAEIQAAEVRMTELINSERDALNDKIDADIAQARSDAEDEYARIESEVSGAIDSTREEMIGEFNEKVALSEQRAAEERARIESEISGVIDSTRSEMETAFVSKVADAREYAEQQAQEKAAAVRTDLETVTSGHQSMLDDLFSSVDRFDHYLGDIPDITLDERFQSIVMDFEEQLRNIDSSHYNIIRGTSMDEPNMWNNHGSVEIITDETDNFARLGLGTTSIPYIMNSEYFNIEAGQRYNLIFTYRTSDVPEIDYIRFRPPGGASGEYGGDLIVEGMIDNQNLQTNMSGEWTKFTVTFTSDRSMPVRMLLGTNFDAGNMQRGIIDIKKPYLTTTNNREWLPHPDDATQSVSDIARRLTLLEDGRRELITRTEYDFDTGQINQTVRDIEETVDTSRNLIQEIQDLEIIQNGSEILQMSDLVSSKVWMNDIAQIRPNLLPQSANAWENGGLWIEGGGENGLMQHIRLKERLPVRPSTTYTLSTDSLYVSNIVRVDIHQYLTTGGWINRHVIPDRRGEVTFTTWSTAGSVRVVLIAREGFGINQNWMEHHDGRIKVKLEEGGSATPFMSALSRVEQRADSIALQVDDQESRISNFTVDLDGILGRVSNIEGDYITQSYIETLNDSIDAVSSRVSDVEDNYIEKSSLEITPEYAQIGSMRIDGDTVGSLLRVSPSGIDAVAEAMRLSGDLFVKGEIQSYAMEAVEGEFARLWADEFEAITIDAEMITSGTMSAERIRVNHAFVNRIMAQSVFANEVTGLVGNFIEGNFGSLWAAEFSAITIDVEDIAGRTAWFNHLYTLNANIERLVSQSVFTDAVHTKALNAIEANIGRVRTAFLDAGTISGDYIEAKTIDSSHIRFNHALANGIIAQSVMTNEIKAVSMDAVYANISSIRSELLQSNVIQANHIQGGNALLDKVFANTAMFERMMAKSGFVSTMSAITLDLHELTIWRPDGVAFVQNGMERFGHPVPVVPYLEDGVETNNRTYWTNSRGAKIVGIAYGDHAGRYYNIVVGMGLRWDSDYAIQNCNVQVRVVNSPPGVNIPVQNIEVVTRRDEGLQWRTINVPLGRPTYGPMTFQIELFRRGDNVYAPVEMRYGRSWISA